MASTVRSKKAPEIINQQLAKALAHPTRIQILVELNQRVMSPIQFSEEFGGGLSKVSYHFRELEKFGCLELVDEKPRRGAVEHFYKGTRRVLFDDANWKSLPDSVKGSVTGTTFQTFLDRVVQAMSAGTFDAREDRHLSWTALVLDERGWDEMVELLEGTLAGALDLQVGAGVRMAESGEEPIAATIALSGFESPKVADRSKQRHEGSR